MSFLHHIAQSFCLRGFGVLGRKVGCKGFFFRVRASTHPPTHLLTRYLVSLGECFFMWSKAFFYSPLESCFEAFSSWETYLPTYLPFDELYCGWGTQKDAKTLNLVVNPLGFFCFAWMVLWSLVLANNFFLSLHTIYPQHVGFIWFLLNQVIKRNQIITCKSIILIYIYN